MEELISVIVPVYNVEAYLSYCLDSILKQTYTNLEIIVVNDGSPDNCSTICERYAKMDVRIKVLHKQNGGLSDARNVGIDCARGDYISFVDSDDYVAEDFIATLYNNMKSHNADISICNYVETKSSVWYGGEEYNEVSGFGNIEALEKLYFGSAQERKAMVVAWNKLYKRDIFQQLRYPVGKRNEDEFIIQDILYKAKKIVYTSAELYYYLQREHSIMGFGALVYDRKRMDQQEAYYKRIKFFQVHGLHKLYSESVFVYLDTVFVEYGLARKKQASKEIYNQIYINFKKVYGTIEFPVKYSMKQKVKYKMFELCPNSTSQIFQCLRALLKK